SACNRVMASSAIFTPRHDSSSSACRPNAHGAAMLHDDQLGLRRPLLRAIPAYLPILRIRRDFLAVVIGAASPLAAGLAAHQLPRLIFRRLEILFTVAATPLDHTGGCRSSAEDLPGRFRNCYRVPYCVL